MNEHDDFDRETEEPNGKPNGGRPSALRPLRIGDILAGWKESGPLVHEATGFATLDERTGGGPVYGSRWYLVGPPDVSKTALGLQLLHRWAEREILCGVLAVDEEGDDLVTREAQRVGFHRGELERREPSVVALVAERLASVEKWIRIFDARWTIDSAMNDLAAEAKTLGVRSAFLADSIQTCEAAVERGPEPPRSVREAVSARVASLRTGSTRHCMIGVATSEVGRNNYVWTAESNENDLAAAKESGAVEYSARVMIVLRSVPARVAADLVDVRLAKNKHGPKGEPFFLRLDRARQTLSEVEAPELKNDAEDRKEAKAGAAKERLLADAAALAVVLVGPRKSWRDVSGAMRAALSSCSTDRIASAKAKLGAAVDISRKGATLNGALLPDDVAAALPLDARGSVLSARPDEGGLPQ